MWRLLTSLTHLMQDIEKVTGSTQSRGVSSPPQSLELVYQISFPLSKRRTGAESDYTNWGWWLARTVGGNWVVVDMGY